MTISKKQLEAHYHEGYALGHNNGVAKGKAQAEAELSALRKQGVIDLTNAAAALAQANAKLTYSMALIANKLL